MDQVQFTRHSFQIRGCRITKWGILEKKQFSTNIFLQLNVLLRKSKYNKQFLGNIWVLIKKKSFYKNKSELLEKLTFKKGSFGHSYWTLITSSKHIDNIDKFPICSCSSWLSSHHCRLEPGLQLKACHRKFSQGKHSAAPSRDNFVTKKIVTGDKL